MSYDEIERQNISGTLKTIHISGNGKAPLSPSLITRNLVQTTLDNIDHDEKVTL